MLKRSVSVIISTYNNPEALKLIISYLKEGSILPDQIIIADDGSSEDTSELINELDKSTKTPIIHCWHEDMGFRKNRILNISLAKVSSDYVVFLDGDCIPHKDFVKDHLKLAEPHCLVQGRRTFIPESYVPRVLSGQTSTSKLTWTFQLQGWFKSLRLPFPLVKRNQDLYGLLGCNLAAWRRDLEAINGFDEEYEGWGIGEDSDLGARLYNLGNHRKFVYGHAIVYHLNHPELSKEHVPESKARLTKTIASNQVRCELGLNLHLKN